MEKINVLRTLKLFLVIILPLVIVLGNFRLVIFDKNLYKNIQQQSGVYQNFPPEINVDGYVSNLIGYYRSQNELDQNIYSEQARKHLYNVKTIIVYSINLLYLTLFISIMGVGIFIVKSKTIGALESLEKASLITFIFMILLALGVLNDFEPLFFGFHKALFRNDLWLFRPDDTLVNLFPQQFFVLFSLKLSVNIILTSAVLSLLSYFLKRRLLNAHKRN